MNRFYDVFNIRMPFKWLNFLTYCEKINKIPKLDARKKSHVIHQMSVKIAMVGN
jgi:hypothetical protein